MSALNGLNEQRRRDVATRANQLLQQQQREGSAEHLDAMAAGARWCYYVPSSSNYDGNGFVPSLVVEGVAGHVPMMGRGEAAQPWYWGNTLDEAQRTCAVANARLGLTPEECAAIVASSMRETNSGREVSR